MLEMKYIKFENIIDKCRRRVTIYTTTIKIPKINRRIKECYFSDSKGFNNVGLEGKKIILTLSKNFIYSKSQISLIFK